MTSLINPLPDMAQPPEIPKIQEQPFALFCHASDTAVVRRITDEVTRQMLLSAPLMPLLRKRLAWYPLLVAEMIKQGYLPLTEIRSILRTSLTTCSVLLQDYDSLAPFLEPSLHSSPASIRRILRDRRACGRPTLRPLDDYLGLLARDPFRHYEALQDPVQQRKLLPQLRDQAALDPTGSSSWTYLYLATRPIENVPAEFVTSLARDQEMLFRALHLLRRSRQLPEAACAGMAEAITEPKWAFHVLSHGLNSSAQEDHLLDLLHTSPPWLAEYWVTADLPADTLRESYLRASSLSCTHECMSELHYRYRWYVAQRQPGAIFAAIAAAR